MRSRIDSAQDKDYWRALVDMALDSRFSNSLELATTMFT